MTKKQFRQLSREDLFQLSLKREKLKKYTKEALFAQKLPYTGMFYSHEVINESDPFEYVPFDMEH